MVESLKGRGAIYGSPTHPSPFSPVLEMQPDHPRTAINLLTILQRERNIRAEQLVKGFPKTLEEYKLNVGIIEGLDLAIAFANEARKKAEA